MLTNNEIKRQMQLGNIVIQNIGENALKKPNSCDIRIGNALYTFDYNIVDTKNGAEYLKEVLYDKPKKLRKVQIPETGFLLEPRKIYLAKTIERVETHGYVPLMNGKTALSLLGVSTELNNGYKQDEYNSQMIISIIATKPTIIYPDIKIGNLAFFKSLNVPFEERKDEKHSHNTYQSGMLSGMEIKARMQGENPDIKINNPSKIVINPNSVNLTLNETIGIYSDAILDIKKKNKVENIEIPEEGMRLYPDEIYLARTNEWTETQNLAPMMSGRSSLGRNGIHVHCSAGFGSPGYKGYWHMGIRVTKPIDIVKDMKCCQIYYYTLEGELTNVYDGYMQHIKDDLGSQYYRALERKKR